MTIPTITTAQTAANSPLNETLIEGLRQRSTYMPQGSIIWQYDFNGLIDPPEGFMRCNGDQVSEANYNAIHGAGTWTTEIGTSTLAGRYLPNLADKYLTDGATQTGLAAITSVGNSGNTADISHAHNHQVYASKGNNASDKIYNSAGNEVDPSQVTKTSSPLVKLFKSLYDTLVADTGGDFPIAQDKATLPNWYSKTTSPGSATQSIQPETIKAKAWIRII